MLKIKKFYVFIVSNILAVALFLIVSRFILPPITDGIERAYFIILEFVLLLFSLTILSVAGIAVNQKLEDYVLKKGETRFMQQFIDALRFCYSLDDFYEIVKNILERKADCSVLYIDSEKDYVLYSSTNLLTSDKKTVTTLNQNFPASWQ
ncbi:MAG: hypothetical protein IJS51_11010, partial [Treponema sp.]|nr:hypothetical protein [Treponema sp.]